MKKVSDNKEITRTKSLTDVMFSWSLEDILNENLYENKVEKIPASFQSAQHYFGSYVFPLLEETRVQLRSSMQNLHRVPFAEVVDFSKFESDATKLYNVKVDNWQNRFSGGEPYKVLPGDTFVLAGFKPESICDLQRVGRSWGIVSVTKKASEKVNEDNGSSPYYFRVKASKDFEVNNVLYTSHFLVFLANMKHNRRIWKSLHMCRNLKIINEVLCNGSLVKKKHDLSFSERNEDSPNKELIESLCSELNESQIRAVRACVCNLHIANPSVELIQGPPGTGKTKTIATLLFTLLRMRCRTLTCAPTEVAIMEVASIFMEIVNGAKSDALFCPLGEILLFGNEELLKVSPEIEEICLDYRVERLAKSLGPEETGWRHCFASMIGFLEGCVSRYHYHISSENESTREKEQENSASDIEKKEGTSDAEVSKGKCKSFLQFFIEIFVSTASPLKDCIFVFCTHLSTSHISLQNFQNMSALISSLDSFESLLRNGNVISEELENLFSCQQVAEDLYIPEVAETMDYKSLLLCKWRSECLSVLKGLQGFLAELNLPDGVNKCALRGFCFRSASHIFCTVSNSYILDKVPMVPPNILVIDEATQVKECELTIPLQLQGVKHAILVGDEYQLPAIVKSNVSDGAGISRSLFERLSSLGHPKHILDMQYRMHLSISLFPNSKFYHNQIMDAPNVKRSCYEKRYLPATMYGPYSFINVIGGREEKEGDEHNRKNMVEVAIVMKILRNLFKEWIRSKKKLSIGVMSPYAGQVVVIRDKIGNRYDKLDGFIVKVKIVDDYQGGEEDVVILSTVLSNFDQSENFILTPQRISVALTRARYCLWILGNERALCNCESIWELLISDAKGRQCFFNADDDKNLAKTILAAKKAYDEFDDLLNADSVLFRSARWKLLFSDNFLKSFRNLMSIRMKNSVLNLLLKLSSGWRPKKRNVDIICKKSSMILKQFKADGLYIACTIDIVRDFRYIQVLKIWDILPDLLDFQNLEKSLDNIFVDYNDHFKKCCSAKCLEGDLEVPMSWPLSSYIAQFKYKSGINYVENAKVSESLLLMKFYYLSSGVVNHLLSDCDGKKMDLPFEVSEEEMDIILYGRSTFILGRSGTGKTTVLVMKLLQKEQHHHMATEGIFGVHSNLLSSALIQNNDAGSSDAENKESTLRQLFVTVSPKLCFAVKEHVLRLKSFACGGLQSAEGSLTDIPGIDDEAQFKDIPDSFVDIPHKCYPLVITFNKFLLMLDGTMSNSFFDRFFNATKPCRGQLPSSRSVLLQTFLRTKEVNYERFCSSYWPRFNSQLTKKIDPSSVYTEIISHIKGSLGATKASNGILSRKDYCLLSLRRVSYLSAQMREVVYDIFQAYERLKMENGEFDMADFVIDIHRRLRCEKYRGDEMDFVYIDEVQDLTMSQIAVFKHVCNNVEEGFVFAGDTAQTIARGVDFRFQDIRHLFYKRFVLESSSNNHGRKDKGQISEIFQLSQNFRAHAGILKLSHSIIELLYHFFPLHIDFLKPETSMIQGEAPVLLQCGIDENPIEILFGNGETGNGSLFGFGADQVILVRDESARKEISDIVGKQALVLTIVECKGLEFQDVLLHNFFGSSPLKNEWRLIYEYMDKQDLLDSSLPKGFPGFNEAKHNMLCSELKKLYVAVTRTKQRLWIFENAEEFSKPISDYWKKKRLVQVWTLDGFSPQSMRVRCSLEDWKSRGLKLYNENNYEMAQLCFEKACETYWERRSKAAGLKARADRLRLSNPQVANSSLREAAEIFEDIGNADSAARCYSDLGEYERAGRIYLDKCGVSALERAGECFSVVGCYKIAADVYAKGNFLFECLNACVQGQLFDIGLEYINHWKQLADGPDEIVQGFHERAAFHYYQVKDNISMMKFVKAFQSGHLMRKFLKNLGELDELLLLEIESENYLEAAKIAKLQGDILVVADFLEKAGRYREASMHILFYVLANSLWSSGRNGWPIMQFPDKEELLIKAKAFAENESNEFYEFICAEVDILSHEYSDMAVIKNLMDASRRHNSVRGEMLCARKILDAHLSSCCTEYLWVEELVGDLGKYSEDKISENRVTIDSLIYFWNFWKNKIVHIIHYARFFETQEANEYRSYGELCLNYLGIWRQYNNLKPVYLLLVRDCDWVRGVDRKYFEDTGNLVSINAHELVSAARSYWSSELLSVGIKVLEKYDSLYKLLIEKSDSIFCQSRCLNQIYEVASYLLQSKCLNRRHQDVVQLQKFVKLSTENIAACISPLSWRKSIRENMISLRRTAVFTNFLKQAIVEYISSSRDTMPYGQTGRLTVVLLGLSGKLYDEQSFVPKFLRCREPWRAFIEYLCGSVAPGNISREPIEVSLVCWLHEALSETYNANWRVDDYISPGCMLYLVERLLVCVCRFQGYVIATRSCFIEWLINQEEDTSSSSGLVLDVQLCFGDILKFILDVVDKSLYHKEDTIEWISQSDTDWENSYKLLVLRLVSVLCLLYLNFGICSEMLFDLAGKSYITTYLPPELSGMLRRLVLNSFGKNVNVLAEAFEKIDNTLVIASFGADCSSVFCSDAIYIDMKGEQCRNGTLRKLFRKLTAVQVAAQG